MARKIGQVARAAARATAGNLAAGAAPDCALRLATVALWATPAGAQDTQLQRLESKIEQIEAQHEAEIKGLQAEIRLLRRQKLPTVAAGSASRITGSQGSSQGSPGQPAPPPPGAPIPQLPPKVVMTYDRGYHFGFSDATGDNTIELFGRLHLDTGGYLSYKPAAATLDQKGLADGIIFAARASAWSAIS